MSNELMQVIWTIVGTVVTGLATWLTTVIITWLNSKIKNNKLAMWSTAVTKIIMEAVQSVFQTYVEALKKEGKFTEAEQRIANEKALTIIKSQLSDELVKYIQDNFGDMEEFLKEQIESMIYQLKMLGKSK
jgi:hypothetical protein